MLIEILHEVSTVSDDLKHLMLPTDDIFMGMLISFSIKTWHLLTLTKVPNVGSRTMKWFIRQQCCLT